VSGLSYLEFHLLFIIPPILILFVVGRMPTRRVEWVGITLMAILAVVYTTPWDNYLIARGVWWYGEGDTWRHLWVAPLGEYLFFVLQSVLTGTWIAVINPICEYEPTDFNRLPRIVGAATWLGVSILGAILTFAGGSDLFYLGATVIWAAPIIALQWGVGGAYLTRQWQPWLIAVVVPSVYLWMVDRIAIGLGVWTISRTYSTGIDILGLPLEEAVFFVCTNLLIVYGLILFKWITNYWNTHPSASGAGIANRWF
jgi:lycopene cyclase domain-containing protein